VRLSHVADAVASGIGWRVGKFAKVRHATQVLLVLAGVALPLQETDGEDAQSHA
jgi:hypothetical protein